MSFPICIIIMLLAGITGGAVNFLLPSNIDPETKAKIRNFFTCVVLGIGATVLVPLFLEIAQSKLLDKIHLGYSWQYQESLTEKKDSVTSALVDIKAAAKTDSTNADSAKPGQASNPVSTTTKKMSEKKLAAEEMPLKNYLLFTAYCFLAAAAGVRFINGIIDSVLKDRQIANLTDKNADEKKKKEEAEAQKNLAEKEKQEAELKKTAAEKAKQQAEQQKAIALKAKEKLSRQNMVNLLECESQVAKSKGKSFATRSATAVSIGEVTVPDDPQKNRFGGLRESGNKKLDADVSESSEYKGFYEVKIWVETTDGSTLAGDVIFYLHDSFVEPVRVVKEIRDNKATVSVVAYGAFTVGAVCDGGRTLLEYDLALNPNFPEPFRNS